MTPFNGKQRMNLMHVKGEKIQYASTNHYLNITIPQKTQNNKVPNKSYIQSSLDTQI